jgi:hypothetical protein
MALPSVLDPEDDFGLPKENYGEVTLNIDPDSIFTGALGGATFAWRAVVEEGKAIEART